MRPDILIVDDSLDQLQFIERLFRMVDPSLKVITATDGDKALSLLRSTPERPKVILLDLRMPGKSGQEVLSEIKSDQYLQTIPVCAFSNGDVQNDICECYRLGASFYFQKPAGLDESKKFADSFRAIWFGFASFCKSGSTTE